MTFKTLLSNTCLLKAITEDGYLEPTPIQKQAIPVVMANKDVMARAQTGTGKTAAFALPLLEQIDKEKKLSSDELLLDQHKTPSIKVLVLTPTRELAQQVYKSFESYSKYTSIKLALAYGGVSIKPQIIQLKSGADVLVATPGRLLDHLVNGSLTLENVKTIVFDEADRMLDMGFKDEINRILNRMPAERQTLLFSATFDDQIFKLSKKLLVDPTIIEIDERNSAASEVEQVVYNVDVDRKRELTSYLIGSKNWQQVLIFVRTKQGADALAKEMCKDGVKTQSIHGDKSQGARDKALLEFKSGKTRALVATDVAARGIDIENLQYVINYELPYIAEDYIHRIGRTGRAGQSGLAVSLLGTGEEWLLEAVEKVLATRLPQQWLPGYEPDLTKVNKPAHKVNKSTQRKRALTGKSNSQRRRR